MPEMPAMIVRRICPCDECGRPLKGSEQHIVKDETGKFPVCKDCLDKWFGGK